MNFRQAGSDGRELLRYVNEDQALRVVPAAPRLIYSNGSFFKPVLPSKDSLLLTELLETDEAFSKATSEKGANLVAGDWDPESVFGLVSALAPASGREPPAPFAKFLSQPDLLFCTDMGTEVADFVIKKGGHVLGEVIALLGSAILFHRNRVLINGRGVEECDSSRQLSRFD